MLVTALVALAIGQGPQIVFPPAPVVPAAPARRPAPEVADGWRRSSHPWQWDLYRAGRQIGSYRTDHDVYRPLTPAGVWGDADVPPVPVPRAAWPADPPKVRSYGVVTEKIRDGTYEVNGAAATRDETRAAVRAAGAALPNDKGKVWVTIDGTDAEAKPVTDWLAGHPYRDRLIVKPVTPDRWETRPGFPKGGHPQITLLGPADAKGRAEAYWAQATGDLAQLELGVAQALRKADPAFDPARVPGPGRPNAGGTGVEWLLLAAALLGIAALFYFTRPPAGDELPGADGDVLP